MINNTTRWKHIPQKLPVSSLIMTLLFAGIVSNSHAQVTIGAGGANNVDQGAPFSLTNGYSRDAAVYTASELNTLNAGGTITTLAWKTPYGGDFAAVKIYLKAIGAATTVTSDTWSNTIAGATLVYDATPSSATAGWKTIDITDFTLAANQNLEVLIESNAGGNGLNPFVVPVPDFTYTAAGLNTHGYITVDNNPPTTQVLTRDNKRPDIRIGGLTAPSCAAPAGLFASGITSSGAKVKFYPPASLPLGYEYYLSSSNTAPDANTIPTGNIPPGVAGDTTVNLTGLNSTTTYYVWGRSDCGSANTSNWSNFISFTTQAIPANDECSGATDLTVNPALTCTNTIIASTAGATQSAPSAPIGTTYPMGINDDIWYKFTATAANHKISLQYQSGNDGVEMILYSGTCNALTYISAISANYYEEMTATGLTPGQVYTIRLYSASPNAGENSAYEVCVKTVPPPPANDNCGNATMLTMNTTPGCTSVTAGTTVSATQSNETPPSSQNAAGTNDDVWYQFTANSTIHRLTLSDYDYGTEMVMALYSGSCGALTFIQDATSSYGTTSFTMDAGGLTAGTTYTVRVFTGFSDATASGFNICVGPPPPPPANDNCGNAALLTANTTGNCNITETGTTLSATQSSETLSNDQNGAGTNDDVWYKFTANDTAYRITLSDIAGSTTDMEMALYSGICGNLTYLQSSFQTIMDMYGLTVGQEYKVRVYTYNAAASDYANFTICLRPVPPANDEASGAVTLTVGAGCTGNPYDNTNATQSTDEPYPSCVDGWNSGLAGMWYKFVAPASGMIKLSCDGGGTMGDSRMALFSATDPEDYSTFSVIACDDNNGVTTGNRSLLYATNLTPGNTYYVNVDYIPDFTNPGAPEKGTYCVTADNVVPAMLAGVTGDCNAGQAISAASSGYHGWMSLVDNSGNLIANVRQLAGTATDFSSSVTIKTGTARTDADGTAYMNRNFLINGSGATSTDVRLFFTNGELTNLGSPIGNLNVTRVSGNTCAADFVYSAGTNTFLAQTGNGSVNGVNYIQFNTPGFSNFYIMPGAVPLPLQLISFDGENKGASNVLAWKTADEQGCSHFVLERSEDGVNFAALSEIMPKHAAGGSSYEYADMHPVKGRNFYRLKMTDVNGKSIVSGVVELYSKEGSNIRVHLAPNPVQKTLKVTVSGATDTNGSVQVTDIVGKVVMTVMLHSDTATVDMSNLANGTYIIRYHDNLNTVVSKVVKR